MTTAPGARSAWALLALLTFCSDPAPGASRAQDAGPGAIRLHLRASFSVVPRGTAVDVTVALRDGEGGPASAPHAIQVELSVEGGPRKTVEFQPGETEMDVSLTPVREGILEIRASGRELVPGSCYVKVTRPQASLLRDRRRGTSPSLRVVSRLPGDRLPLGGR